MLMVDLFAGLGGASQAMRERGWDVVRVDIDPQFHPDIVADLQSWSWEGSRPDLMWASPPCTEFAREFMPWSRTGQEPDMSLVMAALQVIAGAKPRAWVLENVRGAVPWFRPVMGAPRAIVGPFYLWGFFPPLPRVDTSSWRKKESWPSTAQAERAIVPFELSRAVAVACETQPALPLSLGEIQLHSTRKTTGSSKPSLTLGRWNDAEFSTPVGEAT